MTRLKNNHRGVIKKQPLENQPDIKCEKGGQYACFKNVPRYDDRDNLKKSNAFSTLTRKSKKIIPSKDLLLVQLLSENNDRDKKKIYYYSTTKTDFLSYCNKIVGLVKIYVSKLLLILFLFLSTPQYLHQFCNK